MCVHRPEQMQITAHEMQIILWEHDEVASDEIKHFITICQPHFTSAFKQEVEEQRMLRLTELVLHFGQTIARLLTHQGAVNSNSGIRRLQGWI